MSSFAAILTRVGRADKMLISGGNLRYFTLNLNTVTSCIGLAGVTMVDWKLG